MTKMRNSMGERMVAGLYMGLRKLSGRRYLKSFGRVLALGKANKERSCI